MSIFNQVKGDTMKKGIIGLVVIVPILIFFGCSKFSPGTFVMPTWNTEFDAPIFNRTYTLGEILTKSDTMVSNGDTTFLNTVGPASVFSLFRTQSVSGVSFAGNLKIASAGISFSGAYPALQPLVGTTVDPVPAIPQQTDTLSPGTGFQNFDDATISSGTLNITIKNGYPAAIDFPNGISILDPSTGQILLPVAYPGYPLAANSSGTFSLPLAGITLPNNPEVLLSFESSGSVAAGTIQSDTVVAVSLDMSDVVVSSVTGRVSLQDPISIPADTQTIDLGDFKSKFHGAVVFNDSTKLLLNINLSGGFPALVHLVLIPANSEVSNGPIDSAVVDKMIYPQEPNSLDFGPDFVKVINEYCSMETSSLPNEFIISGYVIINPDSVSGTITDKDRVQRQRSHFDSVRSRSDSDVRRHDHKAGLRFYDECEDDQRQHCHGRFRGQQRVAFAAGAEDTTC